MNKYDELYRFRQATIDDLDKVMLFIREYWRPGHILGIDKDFFLYEHGEGNNLNFIICEDKANNEVVGIHGFIPYSKGGENKHVCGVMTMVKKDVAIPMLGVELIKRFIEITNYKSYCGIGTNPKTMVPLVKRLFKRNVGKMQHYYRLNKDINDFKIAKIIEKKILDYDQESKIELVEVLQFEELNSFDFSKIYSNLPYKEKEYIEKRYFKHPIYKYKVFKIQENNVPLAILVGKELSLNDSKILRLVDYIGEVKYLAQMSFHFETLMQLNQYEYIDFLLAGMPQDIMNKAGFTLKDEQDVNIIPNYFEPFVQSNVEIWYEKSDENMIIFKGDADADRPNKR